MASFHKNALLTAIFAALTPTISIAQDSQADALQTTHKAHIHGAWELFAALDGNELSITMSGPLVDLLGFENRPASAEEKAAVENLQTRLSAPEAILTLDKRAGCTLSGPVAITMPEGYAVQAAAPDDGAHDEHEHEDHEHDHDHEHEHEHEHEDHDHDKHEGHEEHEHEHEDKDHDHDEHEHDHEDHEEHEHEGHEHKDHENHDHSAHDQHASDVDLSYTFVCKAPKRLGAVMITGFNSFPAIETVDAVYLSDQKQTAHRLTRNAQSLKIN